MKQATFNRPAGTIFLLIAILHVLRILLGWEAVIAGWKVPIGLSWLAFALAGFLACSAFSRKNG
ncbi:MAG: hypothetical protein HYS41_02185 [Candidatus Omnitrophica bacterium]|nr:hypothetical protein [Candidatus Omnitrophota bacterium]